MTFGLLAGYLASVLVFATFCMKTIVPLRVVAVMSNLVFIVYASVEGLTPILVLHAVLLPLNLLRLWQLRDAQREIERSLTEDFSFSAILPLMSQRRLAAGERLFRIGDPSDELYLLEEGVVELPELGVWLGPGDVMGEIGLFSPRGQRTASAVAVQDCVIRVLPRRKLTSVLAQHPRLGILLLRLVTARLMENAGQAPARPLPGHGEEAAGGAAMERGSKDRPRWRTRRLGIVALAAVALLVGLIGIAPTAYWLLTRDAAVTAWINEATAPIKGDIVSPLPRPGALVGPDGRIVEIRDRQADQGAVLRAEAAVTEAVADLEKYRDYEAEVAALLQDWDRRSRDYAAGYREKLAIESEGLEEEIAFLRQRLDLAVSAAERARTLSRQGYSSTAVEELERQRVLDLEEALASKQRALAEQRLRRQLAERGVFIDEFGRNPDWAYASYDTIRLEQQQAEKRVAEATARLEKTRKDLAAARRSYADLSQAQVKAPAGAIVWSRIAGEGAAVTAGMPVVSWIDCGALLVDVPASDLLVGLLRPGMAASVAVEGESSERAGEVILARGAAAKLGVDDLAAIARGHDRATAQVLLALQRDPAVEGCPVGRAASVDFPDVGFLDLVGAFLRL